MSLRNPVDEPWVLWLSAPRPRRLQGVPLLASYARGPGAGEREGLSSKFINGTRESGRDTKDKLELFKERSAVKV